MIIGDDRLSRFQLVDPPSRVEPIGFRKGCLQSGFQAGSKDNLAARLQTMSARGYVNIAAQYRLSANGGTAIGRGILTSLGAKAPDESIATIRSDPLFKLVEQKRALRSAAWMKHIGYTREKTVKPEPLGTAEEDVAKLQEKIDAIRRNP